MTTGDFSSLYFSSSKWFYVLNDNLKLCTDSTKSRVNIVPTLFFNLILRQQKLPAAHMYFKNKPCSKGRALYQSNSVSITDFFFFFYLSIVSFFIPQAAVFHSSITPTIIYCLKVWMMHCGCLWIVNIWKCVVVRILWTGFVFRITLRLLTADTDIIFHLSGALLCWKCVSDASLYFLSSLTSHYRGWFELSP